MGTPATFPISTASFRSDLYNFDPLLAGECVSQSAKIAPSLGVLKRGTVLFGPVPPAPITSSTNLTTVATGASQRVILAQDIDTGTGAAVTGLVYTAGKFLDTAMIFSSAGAAADAAVLWDTNILVLTVEQRSGLLVPMISLPATGGALPQSLGPKEAAKAIKEEVDAIKNAPGQPFPGTAFTPPPGTQPAWAEAAYGPVTPTPVQEARTKAAEEAADINEKQQKALDELRAKQAKELGDLMKKQHDERAKFAEEAADDLADAQAEMPQPPPVAPQPALQKPPEKPPEKKH